jgi:hypothetical protein
MPRPTGQHATYDREDRVSWRATYADLIEWLDDQHTVSDNAFLNSVIDDLRYYGSLTDAQTAAALRMMATNERAAEDEPTPVAEAGQDDAPNIFNGVYTLNNGTEHLTYRIHTVLRGPLQGKRIIKIQQQYGEFKGFAFLRTDGHMKVWRRFADDERRNERYIVWAGILLDCLRREIGTGGVTESYSPDADTTYEVQRSLCCRRCNRPLTNPSSIDAGLGPECAQREGSRTTAARQRESLDITEPESGRERNVRFLTDPPRITYAHLADSDAAASQADQVFNSATAAQAADNAAVGAPLPFDEPEEQVEAEPQETSLQRQLRQEREMPEEQRLRRMQVLGGGHSAGIVDSDVRQRITNIYNSLPYYRRHTVCSYCGRHDFASQRGCTTHVNNYCQVRQRMDSTMRAERARRTEAQRVARVANMTPNLSALGTVIDGAVWLQ